MFGVYIEDVYGDVELTDDVCYIYNGAFHIAFEKNLDLLIQDGVENPDYEIVSQITSDSSLIYFYHVYKYSEKDIIFN
jgi:hypothetical protein